MWQARTLSVSLMSRMTGSEYLLTSNLPLHIDCSRLRRASSIDNCQQVSINPHTVDSPTSPTNQLPTNQRCHDIIYRIMRLTLRKFYHCSFVTMALSCIVFEIKPRENSIYADHESAIPNYDRFVDDFFSHGGIPITL